MNWNAKPRDNLRSPACREFFWLDKVNGKAAEFITHLKVGQRWKLVDRLFLTCELMNIFLTVVRFSLICAVNSALSSLLCKVISSSDIMYMLLDII